MYTHYNAIHNCHPERSEGSQLFREILRYAQNDM